VSNVANRHGVLRRDCRLELCGMFLRRRDLGVEYHGGVLRGAICNCVFGDYNYLGIGCDVRLCSGGTSAELGYAGLECPAASPIWAKRSGVHLFSSYRYQRSRRLLGGVYFNRRRGVRYFFVRCCEPCDVRFADANDGLRRFDDFVYVFSRGESIDHGVSSQSCDDNRGQRLDFSNNRTRR
jgi:hypothetical protein